MKSKKNRPIPQSLTTICLILLAILLTGCQGEEAIPTPGIYKPPTPAPTSTPTPQLSATTNISSTCNDYLTFIDDITIPDGTKATPGEILVKRWRVKNTGDCNWGVGYSIRLISGPDLGALPTQALYPARKDSKVTLEISFTAPEPGNYTSMWQAYNPLGNPFGDAFYIEFVVEEEE
ncbi:MAG: NBR1-Ig-like domain-containing protein [Chloroflexota bacterium]|nr:NBR1-Ig-like domain-containing protein [Chloroflexota bacterium]